MPKDWRAGVKSGRKFEPNRKRRHADTSSGEFRAKFWTWGGVVEPGLAPWGGRASFTAMKHLVTCVVLSVLVSTGFAASTGITLVQKPKPTETPGAEPPKPAEPATPATPPAKPTAKKEDKKTEKEPVIPGMTIVRPNGTFLGFEAAGGKFKLSFYDKKKKPMAVDVSAGLARWANVRGPGDVRSPMTISGTALVTAKPATPPFSYNVFITLLQGEGDDAKAVETYTVQFRG